MKDVADREINIGDEVAFTVGCYLKTGVVVKIRTESHSDTWSYGMVKVKLTVPEVKPDRLVYTKDKDGNFVTRMNERGFEEYVTTRVKRQPTVFRNVSVSERIILLRSLDNSAE